MFRLQHYSKKRNIPVTQLLFIVKRLMQVKYVACASRLTVFPAVLLFVCMNAEFTKVFSLNWRFYCYDKSASSIQACFFEGQNSFNSDDFISFYGVPRIILFNSHRTTSNLLLRQWSNAHSPTVWVGNLNLQKQTGTLIVVC